MRGRSSGSAGSFLSWDCPCFRPEVSSSVLPSHAETASSFRLGANGMTASASRRGIVARFAQLLTPDESAGPRLRCRPPIYRQNRTESADKPHVTCSRPNPHLLGPSHASRPVSGGPCQRTRTMDMPAVAMPAHENRRARRASARRAGLNRLKPHAMPSVAMLAVAVLAAFASFGRFQTPFKSTTSRHIRPQFHCVTAPDDKCSSFSSGRSGPFPALSDCQRQDAAGPA